MTIIEEILKEGDMVFDVGAHCGAKSKQYLKHGARVIAFEPQKRRADECRTNNNIVVENVALGAQPGSGLLFGASADTISSCSRTFIDAVKNGRFQGYVWDGGSTVEMTTLDAMIVKHGVPNYIKIDVEGFEFEVLQGLTTPVDFLSIEFTPELLSASVKCIEYLQSLCSCRFNYGRCEEQHFSFPQWVERDTLLGHLSSINDYRIEFGDIYVETC